MPEPGRTATGVNFRDPGLSIWVMRRRPGGLGFFFDYGEKFSGQKQLECTLRGGILVT